MTGVCSKTKTSYIDLLLFIFFFTLLYNVPVQDLVNDIWKIDCHVWMSF